MPCAVQDAPWLTPDQQIRLVAVASLVSGAARLLAEDPGAAITTGELSRMWGPNCYPAERKSAVWGPVDPERGELLALRVAEPFAPAAGVAGPAVEPDRFCVLPFMAFTGFVRVVRGSGVRIALRGLFAPRARGARFQCARAFG